MRFAEFYAGQIISAGPTVVTQAEVLEYAQRFDPQWFHTDVEKAKGGLFGELIASGWHTCAMAMRMIVDSALHDSESFASPGLNYVKWPNPVRVGDALSLRATVLDVRRSESKPHLGILLWRWQLFNQGGAPVLDVEATSLFHLK